jgi:8-oxo-dGTP diphosphatase
MKSHHQEIDQLFGGKVRVRVSGILVENHKILLIKQKAKTENGYLWLPAGGGVEFGEKIETCLAREFKEETNLEVELLHFYGLTEFIEKPLHAIELFYLVKKISGEIKKGTDPELSEKNQLLTDIQWFSKQEISALTPDSRHKILNQVLDLL